VDHPTLHEQPIDPLDAELLGSLRDGDGSALDRLIARYWRPLSAYAGRLLGERDSAEDAVQEVFVRLWERRERWTITGSLRTLLYQMTRNIAVDEHRRTNTRARLVPALPAGSPTRTPAEQLDDEEVRAAFQDAVADLPERRREVFLLARFDQLSHREIAAVMGIALPTVANHLGLALAELRHRMQPFLEGSSIEPAVPREGSPRRT
jgi:RNA polymerase sigma-70 factor (ECF subfamily)